MARTGSSKSPETKSLRKSNNSENDEEEEEADNCILQVGEISPKNGHDEQTQERSMAPCSDKLKSVELLNVPSFNSNADTSNNNEKRSRPQKVCSVCGDKAIACNFNAVTCESCKAFFRRNAFREASLTCLFEGHCEITSVTRRFCSKCRLSKCLRIGMKREWILTDEQKQIKRVKIELNKQSRHLSPDRATSGTSGGGYRRQPEVAAKSDVAGLRISSGRLKGNKKSKNQQVGEASYRTDYSEASSKRPRVETRDVAVACPDDLGEPGDTRSLTGGNHYCSLALHCRYCSLMVTGSSQPTSVAKFLTQSQQPRDRIALPGANNTSEVSDFRQQHRALYTIAAPPSGLIQSAYDEQRASACSCQRFISQSTSVAMPDCCCAPALAPGSAISHCSHQSPGGSYAHLSSSEGSFNSLPGSPNLHLLMAPQRPHIEDPTPGSKNEHHSSATCASSEYRANHPSLPVNTQSQPASYLFHNDSPLLCQYTSQSQIDAPPIDFKQIGTTPGIKQSSNPFLMALDVRPIRSLADGSVGSSPFRSTNMDLEYTGTQLSLTDSAQSINNENLGNQTSSTSSIQSLVSSGTHEPNSALKLEICSDNDDPADLNQSTFDLTSSDLDRALVGRPKTAPLSSSEPLVSPQDLSRSRFILYNGEYYSEPACTDGQIRVRLERLNFSDKELELMHEIFEATRFMFEVNIDKSREQSLGCIVYTCDASLRRMIKTVKRIKSFKSLCMDDQIVLLKTAVFKILLLRSMYHYQDDCDGWIDYKSGKLLPLDVLKGAKKSLVYERHRDLIRCIPRPLRMDRLTLGIMSLVVLFDPNINLKHSGSVQLDNLIYLNILRRYLQNTQPDPLTKYENLVSASQAINNCNHEYNIFFSEDFERSQITPLLMEIFDIS